MLLAGSQAALATIVDSNESLENPALTGESALSSHESDKAHSIEPGEQTASDDPFEVDDADGEPHVSPGTSSQVDGSDPNAESADAELEEYEGELAEGSQEAIAPFAVPPVPSNHAVISVRIGGDRIPSQPGSSSISAEGVAGVTLRLSSSETDANAWAHHEWATCVSDEDGDCNFIVPSNMFNSKPWVHAISAPEGYRLLQSLRIGAGSGSESTEKHYRFQLSLDMSAGNVYSSTIDSPFMITSSNSQQSSGYWQVARDNPLIPQSCGLDYAVLMDLSGSIGSQLPNAKSALDSFVNALQGTPSRVALFSFDLTSPASTTNSSGNNTGYGPNIPELRPVGTSAQAAQVRNSYSDWHIGSGTNWDIGLHTVATAPYDYDVVVVLTDGSPTSHGTLNDSPNQDGWNRLRDVEAGIFSANLLKGSGKRIVTVGVGNGAGGMSDLNLQAISGPVLNSDYFQVGNYDQAGEVLAELARGNCEGSITVEKRVLQRGSDISTAVPTADWQFDAASVAITQVSIAGPQTQATNENGQATFGLQFPNPSTTGKVRITETQQEGYSLHQQDGANAVCTNLETGASVPITNVGDEGFIVDVITGHQIHCEVVNLAPSTPFVCSPGDIYSIDGIDAQDAIIRQVNTQTGVATPWGSFGSIPAGGQMNAFGISADGESAFALRRSGAANASLTVLKFDSGTGMVSELNTLTPAELGHGTVAGAVSPVDGMYWVGGRIGPGVGEDPNNNIWEFTAFDPVTGGIVTKFQFNMGHDAGQGDLEFDNSGNMYVVSTWGVSDINRQNIWLIPGSTLIDVVQNPNDVVLTPYHIISNPDGVRSLAHPRPVDRAFHSVAWGSDGYLYTSSSPGGIAGTRLLHRIDPVTGQESSSLAIIDGNYITDFASCANPNTLSVQKDIVDRAQPNDQFLLSLSSGEGNEVIGVTVGTDLGVQDDNPGEIAGPIVGLPGETYTFSESGDGHNGEPIADMSRYTSAYECVDTSQPGSEILASGEGVMGSITIPSQSIGMNIVCTITNTPIPPTSFLLEKWGADSDGQDVLFDGSEWAVFADDSGELGDEVTGVVTPIDGETGRFALTLAPGAYWLVEMQAPDGFQLLAEPVPFTVTPSQEIVMPGIGVNSRPVALVPASDVDPFTIQVYDVPTFDLPVTGGSGEMPFLISGVLLLLAAAAGIGHRYVRRPEFDG